MPPMLRELPEPRSVQPTVQPPEPPQPKLQELQAQPTARPQVLPAPLVRVLERAERRTPNTGNI
jgi:hypothetical protein